jgi:putative ABC transport system ATP-binding protein
MHGLNRRIGLTFIFSTHDARLLEHTERIVRLCDGTIESDSQTQSDSVTEGGIRGQVLASSLS